MASFKNNALLLHEDRTCELIDIEKFRDIPQHVDARFAEMIVMECYPVIIDPDGEHTDYEKKVMQFISDTINRGRALPMRTRGEEYDYHRIVDPSMIQLYIHEFGALIPLTPNAWFSTSPIYGKVVMLGQCCDELSEY